MPDLPQTIGRYEVVDELGRGGMGVVYRGRDPRIGRLVAIKLLSAVDERLRERFRQEAQSVGSLKHRNIVTIFDFGEHDGQPYIVMEFVEGRTLGEHISRNHALPLSRRLELIEELSLGLDYAHNKGIVHRDVKPANVMTDPDGVVKILDFGIARVANSGLTQAGTILGTPNYMAPEQVDGRPVDRRSDIFSVGAVFYELLTHRQAFSGDTVWDVIAAVTRRAPRPIAELSPDLDPALEAIVNRAIEKDPERRYQNLAMLTADLAKVKARLKSAPEPTISSSATLLLPQGGATPAPHTPRPSTDRDLIARRRAERIAEYLHDARQAFDAEQYARAIEACDQAILLDPDDARVVDLLERAREACDRQKAETAEKQRRAAEAARLAAAAKETTVRRVPDAVLQSPARQSPVSQSPAPPPAVPRPLRQLVKPAKLYVLIGASISALGIAYVALRPGRAKDVSPPVAQTQPAAVPSQTPAPPAPQANQVARQSQPTSARQSAQERALASTANALKASPENAALKTLLNDTLTEARARLSKAHDAADAGGEAVRQSSTYGEAIRREQEIVRLATAGRTDEAIRSAWSAAELFTKALDDATAAARATATSANAPRVQPPPPAAPPAPAEPVAASRPAPQPNPAPPPVEPAPTAASEEGAVRAVLHAYADAYSHLDAAAVKRVFPSSNEQALKQAFSGARSYEVQVRNEQIGVNGNTATVSCAWDVTFVGQVGGQQRQSSKITIRLQKTGGAWIIVERR